MDEQKRHDFRLGDIVRHPEFGECVIYGMDHKNSHPDERVYDLAILKNSHARTVYHGRDLELVKMGTESAIRRLAKADPSRLLDVIIDLMIDHLRGMGEEALRAEMIGKGIDPDRVVEETKGAIDSAINQWSER